MNKNVLLCYQTGFLALLMRKFRPFGGNTFSRNVLPKVLPTQKCVTASGPPGHSSASSAWSNASGLRCNTRTLRSVYTFTWRQVFPSLPF